MTPIAFMTVKSDYPNNIFFNPTSYEEAVEILVDHFFGMKFTSQCSCKELYSSFRNRYLDEDWITPNPISPQQVITEQVADMITQNESYRFKQLPWYRKLFLKIYCAFSNTPIFTYY